MILLSADRLAESLALQEHCFGCSYVEVSLPRKDPSYLALTERNTEARSKQRGKIETKRSCCSLVARAVFFRT